MAARTGADFQPRPEVGDMLVVIHDFIARSSDELSLAKGDRVELIERDDEFGDGWFLGRHMANGNSGLFPEVYTRPSPKGVPPVMTTAIAQKPLPSLQPPSTNGTTTETSKAPSITASSTDVTLPLNSTKPESKPSTPADPASSNPSPAPLASKNFSSNLGFGGVGLGRVNTGNQDHPVLHETLTVIDEHITDLKSTPSNGALHNATDSSSEYSAQLGDRMSYIQGEETDEEEEAPHTRTDVGGWTADDVAEYLFTTGVEKKHCEVFRDQEISGEVLLGMDQSSLFLKAFDLGSVGRRLKTWQKIKSLQDEVNGKGPGQLGRKTTQASDAGSESSRRMRSRNNTLTNSQKILSLDDRPGSVAARRLSQTPKLDPVSPMTPVSSRGLMDSPTRPSHQKRPSAASVRELHHSRRHSSTDFRLTGTTVVNNTPKLQSASFSLGDGATHKKQPSFDRNWTMGNASATNASSFSQRPLSSAGFDDTPNDSQENVTSDSPMDVDRGYFSGTDIDGRKRNVLKKRDTLSAHSRTSSYADEQRARSGTAMARHSRFGSMDSVRNKMPPSAAQQYYGLDLSSTSGNPHRRSASTMTTESMRPAPPSKDTPPPIVTKLDNDNDVSPTSTNRQAMHSDFLAKPAKMGGFGGLRAISDAVTGNERAKLSTPTNSSIKDMIMDTPSRTGSSTPSAGLSFELDSPDTAKSPLSTTTSGSQARRPAKNKKETSAYQRGLAKVGPREAIKDAEYSGWMKKKSSHLMTTWKPRLFVLKGRRLAYYYSEDDTEEKGLIDISFHRVLPADNDRLTGLHATITGASNTPMMPADSNLQTGADASAASLEKGDDAMFIFKLVPPRAGLSRAVNFTKPTVHYFAVPNLKQGRMWMAALMKATIDRDETKPMTSTYQQKTISLTKARQMRHRPPALMNLEEKTEESAANDEADEEKKNGLGISFGEVDSAISGLEKLGLQKVESSSARNPTFVDSEKNGGFAYLGSPQSA
ncbi:uncharacterized protein BCR38DRAFT_344955 [Pseudomassariella vexata]|uniref:SAM domain-containing protein n=1 Tax=Pseudomassariella vexata TaxID=1141098 RepID=A0A1Y2DUT0_9PEZI|nr:uncharacterized protein BCR38DRAFT_344955 [Pseudomassariella vexata]ORY62997.1 hypothetical protein BCR38DRAFT_344955 [Pseudomassariella vexata]